MAVDHSIIKNFEAAVGCKYLFLFSSLFSLSSFLCSVLYNMIAHTEEYGERMRRKNMERG